MAAPVTPHAAFPLRVIGGKLVTVEQGSPRHIQDQAEVIIRTRPGDLEATPELGLRSLLGSTEPAAPKILAALDRWLDRRFLAVEDETALAKRVRTVTLSLLEEEEA